MYFPCRMENPSRRQNDERERDCDDRRLVHARHPGHRRRRPLLHTQTNLTRSKRRKKSFANINASIVKFERVERRKRKHFFSASSYSTVELKQRKRNDVQHAGHVSEKGEKTREQKQILSIRHFSKTISSTATTKKFSSLDISTSSEFSSPLAHVKGLVDVDDVSERLRTEEFGRWRIRSGKRLRNSSLCNTQVNNEERITRRRRRRG